MNKFIAKALVVLMTVQSLSTTVYADDKIVEKDQFKLPQSTERVLENVKEMQKGKGYIKRESNNNTLTEKDNNLQRAAYSNVMSERSVNSTVYIPDKNLRNKIMEALGVSNEKDITIESLKTLKKFFLDSTTIGDLEGLQYCTNLESLSLWGDKLNDISQISNLKNLKFLNLGINNISDITALEGLINLESLSLEVCNINKGLGSLSKFTSLKKLYLNECGITDITPLCKLVNLETLNLTNNDIKNISGIENLKNLKELSLDENNIKDFSPLATLNIQNLTTKNQFLKNIPILFNGNEAVIKHPLKNKDGSFMAISSNEFAKYNSVDNTITFTNNNNNNYYIDYSDSLANNGRVNFIPEYTNKIEAGAEIILAEPLTIFKGQQFDFLRGMKAIDKKDGDISTKISVNVLNLDINTPGTYTITYSVTDSDNNITTLTRTVFVEAYNYPTISNVDPVTLVKGDYFNPKAGVQVMCIDGVVSDKVIIENNGYINSNTPGHYTFTYSYTDSIGGVASVQREVTILENAMTVIPLEGANRYETAAKLSSFVYESTDAVVIVNGEAMADGLCVTPLAAALNAPILLTEKETLPQSTIDEIRRLGATYVLIAGGESVVAPSVDSQLQSIGITQIDRVGGANRYETSYMIANVIDQAVVDVSEVVIANGYGEADALSISSAAAYNMMPIILVEKDGIYDYAYYWMRDEALDTAYIIGGTAVVDQGILDMMNDITTSNIIDNRLGGANRYDTNAAVIKRFYKNTDNSMKVAFISKGYVLVDALASGAVACLYNAPVVLASEDLEPSQVETLTPYRGFYIVRAGGGIANKAVETLAKCLE